MGSNPSDEAARAGGQRRSRWRLWGALGLAVILLAAASIYAFRQSDLHARMMRADPDSIADDSELRAFAIASAQPVYDRHCASCHGKEMQGDQSRGVPALSGRKWLYGEGRIAQLEHTILHGIRSGDPKGWNLADMPGFAKPEPYRRYRIEPLEPGDIRDVIEFLLVSGGKPGDREAAERGSAIFQNRGQCFDCHSADVQGDSAIGAPSLIDGRWLYGKGTREDLYQTIARGRAGICPPWIQELDPATIRELAVLIYAASHKDAPKTADLSPGPAAGTGG